MADQKGSSKKKSPDSGDKASVKDIGSHDQLLKRLEQEREKLEEILKDDYKNARRYVRSHPEEGVLFSFAGGVILGWIIGRLTK